MKNAAVLKITLIAAVLSVCAVDLSFAGSYTNDFSSGVGAASLRDNAVLDSGSVRLTQAVNSQQGSLVLNDLDPGQAIQSFTANFNMAIGPSTSGLPADGVSLSFGLPPAGSGSFGERGTPVGLAIGFDTFQNLGESPPSPALRIFVNGVQIAATPLASFSGGAFRPVIVHYDSAGLDVFYNSSAVFTDLTLPGFAPVAGYQFTFGGRTGGSNEEQRIDDVSIMTVMSGVDAMLGLEMALTQREILLHVDRLATRDVNARLFRLRARAEERAEVPATPYEAGGKEVLTHDMGGKVVLSSKDETPSAVSEVFRRFIFFADGDFGRTDQDHIDSHPGFEGDTWAGTLGAEVRVSRELALGFGGTHLESDTSLNDNLGNVDISGFAISAYLSWVHEHFYIDALYSFGCYEDEIRRHTFFGETVRADPDSANHAVALNTGYNFHCGSLITGPIAALEYINGDLDSYSETGGIISGVMVQHQDYDSLVSNLGWQSSFRFRTGFGAVTPQIRASWRHEYLNDSETVTVGLLSSPTFFSARTAPPGGDNLALGGGILVDLGDRFSVVADVEDHLLASDRNDFFAGLRAAVKF